MAADDARVWISQFLNAWGLGQVEWLVNQAISEGWSPDEFLIRLRETDEYKRAFPEMRLRELAGLSRLSEWEVLQLRSEFRRLTREYTGYEPTFDEIARLIASDKSLLEWERHMRTLRDFERWGPAVRAVLEQELGYSLDDQRLFAFISAEIPTPELDRAYEMALLRGRPAVLGLGIRPEEEAELLRQFGINPEEAFRGYQAVAEELPRAERLAAIEQELTTRADRFPALRDVFADTPYATAFRAIVLRDPDALENLRQLIARETARFQAQGGARRSREGASVGLLGQHERRMV